MGRKTRGDTACLTMDRGARTSYRHPHGQRDMIYRRASRIGFDLGFDDDDWSRKVSDMDVVRAALFDALASGLDLSDVCEAANTLDCVDCFMEAVSSSGLAE